MFQVTRKSKQQDNSRPRVLVLGGGISAIEDAGGMVIHMSYTDPRAAEAVQSPSIHALVLTGGSDISPSIYGQPRHPRTQSPFPQRDLVELKTLEAAFNRGIPVLGICRGSQLINAAFGGTLHQHIPDLPNAHKFHNGHDHRVLVERNTKLHKALRESETWVVSLHHQAVDKVAPGFVVSARSKDGIVEAIETAADSKHWVVGVQFHPEIGTTAVMQRLFNRFAEEAARRAGLPPVKPRPMPRRVQPKAVQPVTVRRVAKQPTAPRLSRGVVVTWQCFRCGITFDDRIDHIDHMWFLHHIDLLENMSDESINALLLEALDREQPETTRIEGR